jgi:2-(1,2-epoxy-1,2-dihydrophenyl)acetyl-CoA isomerase
MATAPITADTPELATIDLQIDGEIGTLTLNRPDSLNAMSPELIGELLTAASWLADRAPLRALIVTGAGRAFSSGGDVTWFKEGVDSEEYDLPSSVRRGADVLHQAIVDYAASRIRWSARSTGSRRGRASPWPSCATPGSPRTRPRSCAPTGASAPRPTAA